MYFTTRKISSYLSIRFRWVHIFLIITKVFHGNILCLVNFLEGKGFGNHLILFERNLHDYSFILLIKEPLIFFFRLKTSVSKFTCTFNTMGTHFYLWFSMSTHNSYCEPFLIYSETRDFPSPSSTSSPKEKWCVSIYGVITEGE